MPSTYTLDGFPKGLDTRRPAWAAPADTLQAADDVVLTRDGSIEVRKEFVLRYSVSGTFGMKDVGDALYVFGEGVGTVVPTGVTYQQLASSDAVMPTEVLSVDLYDGKTYVAAQMSDGTRRHFFDGEEVDEWFDGRARASFDITAGATGSIDAINVNGIDVLGTPVSWATSNFDTADAVAAEINAYTSSPNYTAVALGATVIILATAAAGSGANGFGVSVTITGDVVTTTPTTMANGVDAGVTPSPGNYVKTIDSKVYSLSGPYSNFSSIDGPTKWNLEYDGAGFTNMSAYAAGAEDLVAVEPILKLAAFFAQKSILIWSLFADDLNNEKQQVIRNVGTRAAKSVLQFRETDIYFRDPYRGILAIKPIIGGSSEFSALDEVGAPIFPLMKAYADTLTAAQLAAACGVIEPGESRYLLVEGTKVYCHSYYPRDNVVGWSRWNLDISITDFAVVAGRLYARAGTNIYLYGGVDDDTYPAAGIGTVRLPSLRMAAPAAVKSFVGVDLGIEGQWDVRVYSNTLDTTGRIVTRAIKQTFEDNDIPLVESDTNPVVELTRTGPGYARICQFLVHFTPANTG